MDGIVSIALPLPLPPAVAIKLPWAPPLAGNTALTLSAPKPVMRVWAAAIDAAPGGADGDSIDDASGGDPTDSESRARGDTAFGCRGVNNVGPLPLLVVLLSPRGPLGAVLVLVGSWASVGNGPSLFTRNCRVLSMAAVASNGIFAAGGTATKPSLQQQATHRQHEVLNTAITVMQQLE